MVDQTKQPDAEGLRELLLTDWAGVTQYCFGITPWDKQTQILSLLQDHKRVAVRSCHGSGKSLISASAALCFLADCKARDKGGVCITTAPTFRQVSEVLWREIHNHFNRAKQRVGVGGKMLKTMYEMDSRRRALGIATDTPDQFQGIREECTMVIVDEAAGVTPDIYEAIEGILSGENCKLLLIGNPTAPQGEFYNAFNRNKSLYQTIHISAFDTPNVQAGEVVVPGLVTRQWVEERAEMWGVDSPMYQSRVLGDFPNVSEDSVIQLALVERAQRREGNTGKRVLALDVARFGTDFCALAYLDGDIFLPIETWAGKPLDESLGIFKAKWGEFGGQDVTPVVDEIGMGGGIVDFGKSVARMPIIPFDASSRARNDNDYQNARAEAWFEFARGLQDDLITLPDDEELVADLTAPKFKYTPTGKLQLERKEDTKKRLGRSPDRADAVIMAWYYRGSSGARASEAVVEDKGYHGVRAADMMNTIW